MTVTQDNTVSAEVVETATRLIPLLREKTEEARQLARPTDEVISALEDSGLLTILAPKSRGGRQLSLRTFAEVSEELGRACGSTAWVYGIYATTLYMLSAFPDEAQDEVYSSVPVPKMIGSFNPVGEAVPVAGGYRLTGTWRFCSGQHHAEWALLSSFIVRDGEPPEVVQFVVPRGECRGLDDWQVSGLSGSGSGSLATDGVFVPEHRVLPGGEAGSPVSLSKALANDPYFRIPFVPFFSAGSGGAPLGMARTAVDLMKERIQKRGITYSPYKRQAEAPVTHHQMDAAVMKLDQARFHADRAVDTVEAVTEDPGNVALRVRIRADIAWTTKLCHEVVEIVRQASGASAIHRRDPLCGIVADIGALSVHSFLLHSTNAELHGRVLCGLDPEVPYI
ncbi:acyl-CoA dehydrogenase family protein [Streptomyces sp. T028]|uniref:acyl-CoA dehydrogenase family protein n=1 Tax=Streptomyces sp. T028 TaxID=3394379 RepID=UPI003A8A0CF0